MAVSPPPATILQSSSKPIPEKIPNDLGTVVHQNAWRQINREIEIAGPHLTPVPFIDQSHYFDLLSVFSEVEETFFDKVKSTISKRSKFKYVGSLKSMVNFLTVNTDRINDIVQLKDQTPVISSKFIEHSLIGKQEGVECGLRLHIENPHVHAFHFNMNPKIAVGIDRAIAGLDSPTTVLIVAEVFSGSNVSVLSQLGPNTDEINNTVEYFPENNPIPLAFAALKINVANNGVFKSPHVMSPSQLVGTKHWIFAEDIRPIDSPCIRTLTNGLIYSVIKGKSSYDSIKIIANPKPVDQLFSTKPGSTQPGSTQPGSTQDFFKQAGPTQGGSKQTDSTLAGYKQPPGYIQPGSKKPGSTQAGYKQASYKDAGLKQASYKDAGLKQASYKDAGLKQPSYIYKDADPKQASYKHAGPKRTSSKTKKSMSFRNDGSRMACLETGTSITSRISLSVRGVTQIASKTAKNNANKRKNYNHRIV